MKRIIRSLDENTIELKKVSEKNIIIAVNKRTNKAEFKLHRVSTEGVYRYAFVALEHCVFWGNGVRDFCAAIENMSFSHDIIVLDNLTELKKYL